jgi:hypothetical protein
MINNIRDTRNTIIKVSTALTYNLYSSSPAAMRKYQIRDPQLEILQRNQDQIRKKVLRPVLHWALRL